jgi:hypothetical protein
MQLISVQCQCIQQFPYFRADRIRRHFSCSTNKFENVNRAPPPISPIMLFASKCKNKRSEQAIQECISGFSTAISIAHPTRCSNFPILFYFLDNTQHVSVGLSVHHQEFKTVHTATVICPGSSNCLTYTCCCMYSLELLMMDGKSDRNM